jgi:hypothetical protein
MKPSHVKLPDKLTPKDLHGKTVKFDYPNGFWGTGKLDVLPSPDEKHIAIVHIIDCSDGKKHLLNQKAIDCLSKAHNKSKSDFQLFMGK